MIFSVLVLCTQVNMFVMLLTYVTWPGIFYVAGHKYNVCDVTYLLYMLRGRAYFSSSPGVDTHSE